MRHIESNPDVEEPAYVKLILGYNLIFYGEWYEAEMLARSFYHEQLTKRGGEHDKGHMAKAERHTMMATMSSKKLDVLIILSQWSASQFLRACMTCKAASQRHLLCIDGTG